MKFNSLLTTTATAAALVGMITVWNVPVKAIDPVLAQASAPAMADSTGADACAKNCQTH